VRRLVPWFLAGALGASVAVNLALAGRAAPPPPAGERPVKPDEIGVTAEQRAQMLCCDG